MAKKVKKESDPKQSTKRRKRIALFKFFGIFAGVIAIYYLVILNLNESIFDFYVNFTASLSAALINIFDSTVKVSGSILFGSNFSVDIRFGCEGSEPIILFAAAVLAFPTRAKPKLIGLLSGALVLYILNLFRIAALYEIGSSGSQAFDMYHVTIFPVIFIVLSLALWMIWIKFATKAKKQ